ncbi:MMPL family transporter [Streptomyces sp. NPDC001415]
MVVTGLAAAVDRVAGWSAAHPRRAIALWLAVVAASVVAGGLALRARRTVWLDTARAGAAEPFSGGLTGVGPAGTLLIAAMVVLVVMTCLLAAIPPALLTVLVALSAVAAATGWWALAALCFADHGPTLSVLALAAVLGASLGLIHSLVYLWRERLTWRRWPNRPGPAGTAAASSRSVLRSCCVTIVVTCGLYASGDAMLSAVATGVILTVAAVMLASLTVLPAVCARYGRRLGWPRLPVLWRLAYRLGPPRLWPALLRPGVRRPVVTLVSSTVVLCLLALPLLWWDPTGGPIGIGGASDGSTTELTVGAVALSTVLLTFAVLTAVFRSAPAALAVTLPSALASAASCGLALLILTVWKPRQAPGTWGHSTTAAWAPLLSFVLALAVSVNLHRFVVGHVLEYGAHGMPAREATVRGLTGTSDAVTGGATVMGTVFALATQLCSGEVGRLSVVLITSVALNATLVRALTLPSLLILLGGRRLRPQAPARGTGPTSREK